MSAETDAAQRVAERAVQEISKLIGVELDPATIIGLAGLVTGVVGGAAWKQAHQRGIDAAANITTPEEAERLMRAK